MVAAYTYLIGWTKENKFYYGVRFAKNSDPSELWTKYKTSSKHVHKFAGIHGDPDIIQVRKKFEDVNLARIWESKVLKRMHVVSDDRFLNKTDNVSISPDCRGINSMLGKKHNEQTLEKLRRPKTEEHKKKMRGKRPHFNQTGLQNNNFKGWYITPWGKFDSISEAANTSPFPIPVSTLICLCKNDQPMKKKSKYIPAGKSSTEFGYNFEVKA